MSHMQMANFPATTDNLTSPLRTKNDMKSST
jgi:hypothetical protein